MSEIKAKQSLENLKNALSRLKEALDVTKDNQLMIDGTIQRFEFAIELYWKTLKRLLALEGIETKTPKDTLKEAYQINWIEDEAPWLEMLRDRNMTSHTYSAKMAAEIFEHIQHNYPALEKTYSIIIDRYSHLMK